MTKNPAPMKSSPSPNLAGAEGSSMRRPRFTHSAPNTGANTMIISGFTACSTPAGMTQPSRSSSV